MTTARKPIRERRWMVWSPLTGLRGSAFKHRKHAVCMAKYTVVRNSRVIEVEIREVVKRKKRKAKQ